MGLQKNAMGRGLDPPCRKSGIRKGALGSRGPRQIKNMSPWSYPDAAAAGAAADAASAAASAVCIYYVIILGALHAPV